MRSTSRIFGLLLALAVALPYQAVAQEEVNDPLEGMNRGIFWFNDKADSYVFEPLAEGYDYIVPDKAQDSVTNFFHNLRYPRYLVSDLVQGKFEQSLDHTARFLINSTVGVLGLFDFATDWGFPEHEEDFGLALASHGVGPGAYIVLPVLGPSNVRDAIGSAVDFFLDPFVIFGFTDVRAGIQDPIIYTAYGLKFVNTRAELLDAVDTAKSSSLDYYLFLQGAYYQHRWGLINRGKPQTTNAFGEDDEYFPPPGGPALNPEAAK